MQLMKDSNIALLILTQDKFFGELNLVINRINELEINRYFKCYLACKNINNEKFDFPNWTNINVPKKFKTWGINPKICNYQDRLSQTMLHLAALFDNTEIAILLLNAGADPLATNHDKETPIDIAMPVLQEKMKQYQCRRSLSTVVKNDED